jgi:UDP-2-acetamido-2,6-beta-L-arabino-hexul-4-ose reductase
MKTHILVTGSNGFIGRNLIAGLRRIENAVIAEFDVDDDINTLTSHLKHADWIFHLAGINRPKKVEEFEKGNVGLTHTIVSQLEDMKRTVPVVFASSIQATLDNPYGRSKKKAEDVLIEYSKRNKAKIYIYRLPNVFGKWSRPNYNSVVATFCYNISHDLDITISDKDKELCLVYIDDVVVEFTKLITDSPRKSEKAYYSIERSFKVTLGELAEKIYQLKEIRKTLLLPDFNDEFMECLYATYLSFLDVDDFVYSLEMKEDKRGCLFEILKSPHSGQIFVSTSHKGVQRGNHYHDTKVEKFCVIKGKAVIRLRNVLEDEVISLHVSEKKIEVVDIPPGFTHSIENLSDGELVVLFWANQVFDPQNPDTHFLKV